MYLASAAEAATAAGAETPKTQVIFEQISERWEVAFALSTEQQFQQVSFVNSISTIKGGTHVEAVASQLSDKLCVPPFLSSLNCSLDLADL
jgi:DNA topoisomerase-2